MIDDDDSKNPLVIVVILLSIIVVLGIVVLIVQKRNQKKDIQNLGRNFGIINGSASSANSIREKWEEEKLVPPTADTPN